MFKVRGSTFDVNKQGSTLPAANIERLWLVVSAKVLYETEDHAFGFGGSFIDRGEFRLHQITLIQCNIEMALELRCGSKCIMKKLNEFRIGAAIKPFGNIRHYGYRRSSSLIHKTKVSGELVFPS